MLKYTAGGSTMVYDRLEDPSLRYPDLFLCPNPGFKLGVTSNLSDITENPWHSLKTMVDTDKVILTSH